MIDIRTLAALTAMTAAIPATAQVGVDPGIRNDGTTRQCLVLGDSLAVGLGAALKRQGRSCDVAAKIGITAWQAVERVPFRRYAVAYVAVGSNQPEDAHLEDDLRTLRSWIRAPKVIWVMPYDRTAAAAVNRNAAESSDLVVDAAWWTTRDGIHPVDYAPMAAMIVK